MCIMTSGVEAWEVAMPTFSDTSARSKSTPGVQRYNGKLRARFIPETVAMWLYKTQAKDRSTASGLNKGKYSRKLRAMELASRVLVETVIWLHATQCLKETTYHERIVPGGPSKIL